MKKYLFNAGLFLFSAILMVSASADGGKKSAADGSFGDRPQVTSVTFELALPGGGIAYDGLSKLGSRSKNVSLIAYSDMAVTIIAEGYRALYGDEAANKVLKEWFQKKGLAGPPTYLLISGPAESKSRSIQRLSAEYDPYGDWLSTWNPYNYVPSGPPGAEGDGGRPNPPGQ